jgi:excisionase family DNA binding protein
VPAVTTPKPKKKTDPAIWTVADVADYLRMSRAKVYRLVKDQQIPVARIGKTWRFRKDLLDDWLNQSTELSMKKERSSRSRE